MSFHPSALRPRVQGNNHYANFIVLPDPDNEIADQRYRYIKGTTGTSGLREFFQEIQVFMKQNNCMMDAFKNMLTLEQEAAANQIDPGSLKFRIVSPHEVDDSFFKKVGSHKGVYAVKSRMGTGYVSVAYSFEPNSSIFAKRIDDLS